MLDKIRGKLNIFILFIFVVSLVYGIVIIINNAFNPKVLKNVSISDQNVNIYTTSDNLITAEYSKFFTIEVCVQEVITALHDNKISDVYNVLTDDVKSKIGNDKSKLTDYYNQNFKYEVTEGSDTSGYQNYNNLKQLYKINNGMNNMYICVVTSTNESKITKIGITLIDSTTYVISYIDM
jgi:hypothetical protein